MADLVGIQPEVRERFYRHASRVPPHLAAVSESLEKDQDIDYGADQLVLRLVPTGDEGCELTVFANESFCGGKLGKHFTFLLIARGKREKCAVASYPEIAEGYVRNAVYGHVVEREWTWRDRVLLARTYISSCGRSVDDATAECGLVRRAARLILGVTRRDKWYVPYASPLEGDFDCT